MFVVMEKVAVLSFSAPLLPLLQSAGRESVAFCGPPSRPPSKQGRATATGRHGARCGGPLFCTRGVLEDQCSKPSVQLAAVLVAFVCHVAAAGVYIRLPLRWAAVDVGGDSVVGSLLAMAIGGAAMHRRRAKRRSVSLPWSVPSQTRYELLEATAALLAAFLLSGCVGSSLAIALDALVGIGVPLTPSASQALHVLGSHTAWVLLASHVLGSRLKPFFHAGQWFRISWRSHWLAWVIGGYVASVASYAAVERVTDVLLRVALPAASAIREAKLDSVVSALASPQQRSGLFSLLVGCIAPCVTAPIFEEVLYRGFVLPALMCFVPLTAALPLHALLFGLHHLSLATLLPLSTLGLLWAALYVGSRNLLVPMLVHALWNCRVFALAYWEL